MWLVRVRTTDMCWRVCVQSCHLKKSHEKYGLLKPYIVINQNRQQHPAASLQQQLNRKLISHFCSALARRCWPLENCRRDTAAWARVHAGEHFAPTHTHANPEQCALSRVRPRAHAQCVTFNTFTWRFQRTSKTVCVYI